LCITNIWVRVTQKKYWRIRWQWVWTTEITDNEEQSSRNSQKSGCSGEQSWVRIGLAAGGIFSRYPLVNFVSISLSSLVSEHSSERRQTPLLFLDQWHQRAFVRYLPETMTACTVAMATLEGEEPAVLKSGCVEVMDMQQGLK
jgi:hypothetical protein